jgi:hypothetical protein
MRQYKFLLPITEIAQPNIDARHIHLLSAQHLQILSAEAPEQPIVSGYHFDKLVPAVPACYVYVFEQILLIESRVRCFRTFRRAQVRIHKTHAGQ